MPRAGNPAKHTANRIAPSATAGRPRVSARRSCSGRMGSGAGSETAGGGKGWSFGTVVLTTSAPGAGQRLIEAVCGLLPVEGPAEQLDQASPGSDRHQGPVE